MVFLYLMAEVTRGVGAHSSAVQLVTRASWQLKPHRHTTHCVVVVVVVILDTVVLMCSSTLKSGVHDRSLMSVVVAVEFSTVTKPRLATILLLSLARYASLVRVIKIPFRAS